MEQPRRERFSEAEPAVLRLESAPGAPRRRPGGWLEAAVAAEARVMTPEGPRPAGALRAGDAVLTYDDGPAPVLWCGRWRVAADAGGLGPVAFEPGALGPGEPRRRLRVSPRAGLWRTLERGPHAEAIVPAGDLVSGAAAGSEAVDYVQILLPRHGLIAVDGVLVETLHPARIGTGPEDAALRAAVLAALPALDHDADAYGPCVRPRAVRGR